VVGFHIVKNGSLQKKPLPFKTKGEWLILFYCYVGLGLFFSEIGRSNEQIIFFL